MKSIRLLPVVILAVAALLVLKTMGLVMTGSYVLGGVAVAQAEEGGGHNNAPAETAADGTITLAPEPTMADSSPTMADGAPTLGEPAAAEGGHGAPAPTAHAAPEAGHAAPSTKSAHGAEGTGLPPGLDVVCPPSGAIAAAPVVLGDDPSAHATAAADCVPLVDALPAHMGSSGEPVPLIGEDGKTVSETALLESLGKRRSELEDYQQELTLRSSLVDAAERKIEERQATLEALEAQISALVDQRTMLETGQFTGIVTLYENMKPKDAAKIFNSLDMEVLLRVSKMMNPRKMSPILAAMEAPRAQELTVRMAALSDQPPEQMTPDALAALPQIVGQ